MIIKLMKRYRFQYLITSIACIISMALIFLAYCIDEIDLVSRILFGFVIFIFITISLITKGVFYDYFKYKNKTRNIFVMFLALIFIFSALKNSNIKILVTNIIPPFLVFGLNFLWYRSLRD